MKVPNLVKQTVAPFVMAGSIMGAGFSSDTAKAEDGRPSPFVAVKVDKPQAALQSLAKPVEAQSSFGNYTYEDKVKLISGLIGEETNFVKEKIDTLANNEILKKDIKSIKRQEELSNAQDEFSTEILDLYYNPVALVGFKDFENNTMSRNDVVKMFLDNLEVSPHISFGAVNSMHGHYFGTTDHEKYPRSVFRASAEKQMTALSNKLGYKSQLDDKQNVPVALQVSTQR